MVYKVRSHWGGGIGDILPVVQRDNNSDTPLHNVLIRILGGRDDPGSNSGTHAFVVGKNGPFIVTCYNDSLNKNGQDSPEKQVCLHLVFTLKPLEVELRRLEDLSESIVNDFAYMKKREEEMRDTNESTNTRVLYFSIFSMFCLIGLATWQVFYLRRFFKAKKLIE